jgi:hypothetical protein
MVITILEAILAVINASREKKKRDFPLLALTVCASLQLYCLLCVFVHFRHVLRGYAPQYDREGKVSREWSREVFPLASPADAEKEPNRLFSLFPPGPQPRSTVVEYDEDSSRVAVARLEYRGFPERQTEGRGGEWPM